MVYRIPSFDQAVGESPLPSPRIAQAPGPEYFGAGLARAVGGGLSDLAAAVVEGKTKHDEGAALEAFAKLGEEESRLRLDPTTGIVSRRGRDAIGSRAEFLGAFDERAKSISESLGDGAREIFRTMALRRRDSYVSALDNHIANEGQILYRQGIDSALAVASNDVAVAARTRQPQLLRDGADFDLRDAMDFDGIDRRLRDGAQLLKAVGGTEKAALDWRTAAHVGAIKALLSEGRVDDAEAYVQRYRGDMASDDLAAIEPQVRAAGKDAEISALADQASVVAAGNTQKALEIASQAPLGIRDEVKRRTLALVRDSEFARRETEEPIVSMVELDFRRGVSPTTNRLYAGLSPQAQLHLRQAWEAYIRQRRDGSGGSEQDDIDRRAMHAFDALDLAGNKGEDQVSIQRTNPLFGGVSEDGWNQILAKQKARRRSVENDGGVSRSQFRQQFDIAAAASGYPRPRARSEGERADAYFQMWSRASDKFDAWAADPAQNKGLSVPPKALVDEWVSDEFMAMVDEGWAPFGLLDTKKPRGALTEAEIASGEYRPAGVSPAAAPRPGDVVFSPTTSKPGKVTVTDGTESGQVDRDKLDAFLEQNPTWRPL